MGEKDKFLKKIKKLLALARNNSSAEEAALAMNRAQELMTRHNITSQDAAFSDISEAKTDKSPSHAEKDARIHGLSGRNGFPRVRC